METLKEPLRDLGRTVVLAIIPVFVISLEKGTIDWKTVGIVGVIAGLRFIEKWLYEIGKEEKDINAVSKILQFR